MVTRKPSSVGGIVQRWPNRSQALIAAGAIAFGLFLTACGGPNVSSFRQADEADASTSTNGGKVPQLGGGGWVGPCTGLECQVSACSSGETSISGTVYDPAGRNPLYNIVVYIPNAPPEPIPTGAACGSCEGLYSGKPIETAITDAAGHFVIENAPDGRDIPLVIQVGKWRREIKLPRVEACVENKIPDGHLTLPKNHDEGNIPMIAVSTGGSDTLECLLSRIGLDASEYSPGGAGPGHIQIYQGDSDGIVPNTSPPGPLSPDGLWDTLADLMRYDIVLLSCEGHETSSMNQAALEEYTAVGGRVFASHFHYAWFNSGPFASNNLASWTPGINDIGDIDADVQTRLPDGAPFPKGIAMQKWLENVGALQGGQLPLVETMHNADVSAANSYSTPWLLASPTSSAPNATQYFSFDTPVGSPPAEVCGRVVYSDLHVGAASNDQPSLPVPQDCTPGPLSPQEMALEFMLFDLSSCIIPVTQKPAPPLPSK